uniref:Uncharacterized protein n=1 Tax=viral metagenome TaxID=1070528 RepID=A0A6M3LWC5_9ZZZZ
MTDTEHDCGDPTCPGQDGDPCHYEPPAEGLDVEAAYLRGREAVLGLLRQWIAEMTLPAQYDQPMTDQADAGDSAAPAEGLDRDEATRDAFCACDDPPAPAEGLREAAWNVVNEWDQYQPADTADYIDALRAALEGADR